MEREREIRNLVEKLMPEKEDNYYSITSRELLYGKLLHLWNQNKSLSIYELLLKLVVV